MINERLLKCIPFIVLYIYSRVNVKHLMRRLVVGFLINEEINIHIRNDQEKVQSERLQSHSKHRNGKKT